MVKTNFVGSGQILGDYALPTSHDELWTTGAGRGTGLMDHPPEGKRHSGHAFDVTFVLE